MQNKSQMRTVVCSQGRIKYLLTRKPVKNINLRINRSGEIHVSAAPKVSAAYIDSFVVSREEFIIKALNKISQYQESVANKRKYLDGERIYILGKPMRLRIEKGLQQGVEADDCNIYLTAMDPENAELREKLIKDWMCNTCEKVFNEICQRMYPSFEKLGIRYPRIKIRQMESRWGSCRPTKGSITLNSRLLAMPEVCIEYVVLHEFSHFIHPNHSRQFHEFVGQLMPDWKDRKTLLEKCNLAGMR